MNAPTRIRPSPEALDLARSATTIALAVAQPLGGRLSKLTGRGESIEERSAETRGPATPADGAFAIWAPVMAGSLAQAVLTARRERRGRSLERRVGWLAAAAYAGNLGWELHAQFRGIGWRSVGIIAATAAAAGAGFLVAERADEGEPGRALLANTLAPLAGWLTVATAADVAAARVTELGRPSPERATRETVVLLGAATVAAAGMAFAGRGNPLYAGAVGWGLGGIVVRNVRERNRPVALAAGLGLAALAGATLLARRGR